MPSSTRTVLLVGDNATIRQILCGLFESAGFCICAEAANGAEAIEQAAKYQPDLIVLDLSMPVLNGLETAKVLRKTLPPTPIILFTMYAGSILKKEALAAGISSVVSKIRCEHADWRGRGAFESPKICGGELGPFD